MFAAIRRASSRVSSLANFPVAPRKSRNKGHKSAEIVTITLRRHQGEIGNPPMIPADEIATKIEPTKRRSAAEEGSDERLRALLEKLHDDKLNEQLKDFRGVSLQPGEDLDNLIPRVSRLDETYDRVRAMESRTKRRSSRGFARFLVAICIGVAGTLAWQSYGEATKQIIATRAPQLGWSPESKQMIASGIQQLGWTKPSAGPENTAPQQTVAPQASTAPSLDPAQVQQMVQSLAALRESVQQLAAGQESLAVLAKTVDRLAAAQDQMARAIDRLRAADQEILVKIPESPPPPPIAAAPAVAGRPAPGGSRPAENTQNTAPTSASIALRASCGPDVQRLCRGISIENGDVIKGLNSYRMELSPTCVAYFKQMPVDRAAQKGAPKATSPNPVTPPSSRAPVPPRQ
jgi:hypothetical protein